MPPTRILFPFAGDTGLGGSHVSALDLIAGLDRDRFTPIILLHQRAGRVGEYARDLGLDFEVAQDLPLLRSRNSPRKGDVITHFSPTMVAMLLPTVDYSTGDSVMERLKQKFYQAYPNSNVLFSYRIAPLNAQMAGVEPQKARRARRKPTKTIRTTKKKGE